MDDVELIFLVGINNWEALTMETKPQAPVTPIIGSNKLPVATLGARIVQLYPWVPTMTSRMPRLGGCERWTD